MTDQAPAYERRMTERVVYCPRHIGIAFPAYHVSDTVQGNRLFECSECGFHFDEAEKAEVDPR